MSRLLNLICSHLGDLTQDETYELFHHLWEELTDEQQEFFVASIDEEDEREEED